MTLHVFFLPIFMRRKVALTLTGGSKKNISDSGYKSFYEKGNFSIKGIVRRFYMGDPCGSFARFYLESITVPYSCSGLVDHIGTIRGTIKSATEATGIVKMGNAVNKPYA